MVFVLGSSGYIGQAFGKELSQRKIPFRPVSRKEINYADYRALRIALQKEKPAFVINAAGFTGKPNVDACENQKGESLEMSLLPKRLPKLVMRRGCPWASSPLAVFILEQRYKRSLAPGL